MKNKKAIFKQIFFIGYLVTLIVVLFLTFTITLYAAINDLKPGQMPVQQTLKIINENTLKNDFSEWNKTCDWNLIIVNNKNKVQPSFRLNLKPYSDINVDYRIIYYLKEMISDAENQNIKLWVSSGYRSVEKQNKLFQNKIQDFILKGYEEKKAEILAQDTVAKPETSEHHLGLAIDLNGVKDDFCYSNEYNWLVENCTNYGFILRYEKEKQNITGKVYEPWHFRYVGESHAKKMKEKNMCLEEYVSYLIYQNS